jgi:Ca2+-transporting ATPase
MAGVTLFTQWWGINSGKEHWQTMVLTVLSLSQLGQALAVRSGKTSIYKLGFFSNLQMLIVISGTFLLQLAIIYLPFFNKIFKTMPLSIGELIFCLLASSVVFIAVELEKILKKAIGCYT